MPAHEHSALTAASSRADTIDPVLGRYVPAGVVVFACAWTMFWAGLALIGWLTNSPAIVEFPSPPAAGTMMPLTATGLLLCTVALWLIRDERHAHGVHLHVAHALATVLVLFGALFLWEYATRTDLGIDRLLFPRAVNAISLQLRGRPALPTSFAFVACGFALLVLDTKSWRLIRTAEVLIVVVALVMLVRILSDLYGESGIYAPRWTIFGNPVLSPISPKTASCFILLSAALFFARPIRGIVSLYLGRGPAGTLSRWLMPVSLLIPATLGFLGLMAIRLRIEGPDYPLSMVITGIILLLMIVISLNARAIHGVDVERNRAQDRLAERERVLSAVFDNAGAGLALVDEAGYPVASNAKLQKMLGYSAEELATMPFTEFTYPDDAAADQRLFEEMLAGKRDSYRIEKRYVRKDGRLFWAQLNTSVRRNAHNQIEYLVGMVEDITERKEAEDLLARYKAVLDATPDFVGMADAQTRALYVNRAGREMTGVGEDIAGLTIPDFHPEGTARRLLSEALPTALRRGVWTGESEVLGPNGEHIPVSQVLLVHFSDSGKVAYYSTIMRDITERKQFEDSQAFLLEASRALSGSLEIDSILRSIAALIVPRRADYCAVTLLADDGTVERAAAARRNPAGGERLEELRVYSERKELNPVVAEVIQSGEAIMVPTVKDVWLKRLIGQSPNLEDANKAGSDSVMLIPLRARDHVIGLICLGVTGASRRYTDYDFAQAKELALRASLALDNARLFQESREATRLRDEVLRVVAHDLRNPLNTISLSADLLEEVIPSEHTEWHKKLDVISRSVSFADRLIQDLLDVARLQVGKLTIDARPLDAAALVSEVIELLQPAAAKHDIKLRSVIPGELPRVHADNHRVQQVLANLIGNSIKFSPEGTTVVIGVEAHDDELRFFIQDEGPGIDPGHLPHLFDPFWQAHTGGSGAGLGLAISKGIVRAHGGKIWVESKPGAGSMFCFTLPVADRPHSDSSMAAD